MNDTVILIFLFCSLFYYYCCCFFLWRIKFFSKPSQNMQNTSSGDFDSSTLDAGEASRMSSTRSQCLTDVRRGGTSVTRTKLPSIGNKRLSAAIASMSSSGGGDGHRWSSALVVGEHWSFSVTRPSSCPLGAGDGTSLQKYQLYAVYRLPAVACRW